MSPAMRSAVIASIGLAMTANAVAGLYRCICPDDHSQHSSDTEMACDDHAGQDTDNHGAAFNAGREVLLQPQDGDSSLTSQPDSARHTDCPPACLIACATAHSPAFPILVSGHVAAFGLAGPPPPAAYPAPGPSTGLYRPPRRIPL